LIKTCICHFVFQIFGFDSNCGHKRRGNKDSIWILATNPEIIKIWFKSYSRLLPIFKSFVLFSQIQRFNSDPLRILRILQFFFWIHVFKMSLNIKFGSWDSCNKSMHSRQQYQRFYIESVCFLHTCIYLKIFIFLIYSAFYAKHPVNTVDKSKTAS
jgi:hypothetical protein